MSKCKYYVTVLKKVSFSETLFQKEYNKACSVNLNSWIKRKALKQGGI